MTVEFTCYLFFLRYITSKLHLTRGILLTILLYIALSLLNFFFIQGASIFNTYTYILGSVLVVVLCVVYFNFLFRFARPGKLTAEPVFWIVTGLLFYYTCSLFVFGITNFVTRIPTRYYALMVFIGDFLNILLSILFSIGFLCKINFQKLLRW